MKIALVYFLFAMASMGQCSFAQTKVGDDPPLTSLKSVLNPDGTINASMGIVGSLDASGWRMQTGASGAPVFTPAFIPADSLWDDRFNLPDIMGTGSSGTIRKLATDGTNLYAVGPFVGAGRTRTNGIAKWDGSNWTGIGTGVSGAGGTIEVYSVAVGQGNVYVGGAFDSVNGVPASCIAKWNGTSWSALGSGTSYGVNAIAVSGSDVYVGGYFYTAGGIQMRGIAKWNGSSWDSLGSGLNGDANAIAVIGTDVYVGGHFTTAGGVPARNIAKWNGTRWDSLGSGPGQYDAVSSLAVVGTDLYVGGPWIVGADTVRGIAKWNGTTWSALGTGINGSVMSLTVVGTDLYAGGVFIAAGGVSASNIAKWNGTSWSALGAGLGVSGGSDRVTALAAMGGALYAGGDFTVPTTSGEAHSIVRWNGSGWLPLHSAGAHLGMNQWVAAVAVAGDQVYVGGNFTSAGGITANGIARWNGTSWNALGTGMNDGVRAIAVKGDTVYAGGYFTSAGGVSANRIARWNGSSWSAIGSGMNGGVLALAVSGNDVYAGGEFTTAGGISASRIAKWNGSNWSPLGTGVGGFGRVQTLSVSGTDLYAGGFFESIGGVSTYDIAKWNGGSWSALGAGLMWGQYFIGVTGITISGSTLYAVGDFILSGGRNKIARWDGTSWSGLGGGITTLEILNVYAVAVRGNELFVGGNFNGSIARWDGSSWLNMGSNIGWGSVAALAINGGNIYVGGDFLLVGDKLASRFSRWFGSPVVTFQPPSGGVGSTVTITGGEFDLTPSNNTVRFGAIPAAVTSATLSTLTVTVPAGATTAPLSVTTRNLTGTSSTSFVVNSTDVEQGSELLPKTFALSQNFPNPFNPSTRFKYQLPIQSRVELKVYDVLGREVATIVDGVQEPGYKSVEWNASAVASGVYFYRLDAGSFTSVKKLLLLK